MKKLKIILRHNIIYILLLLLIPYFFIINNFKSKFTINDTNINGVIKSIKYSENKTTFILKSKELILCNYYDYIDLDIGDKINITGYINNVRENTNFNLFNYKNYLKSKKINYIFKVDSINITKYNTNIFNNIKNTLIKRIKSYKSYQYLNTFILGSKDYLDDTVYSSYQNNGVSHLLAISGMHVSFLATILLFMLNKIKKSNKNYIIVILFLLFYSFLTDFTPSILRSFLLFTYLYINKILKLNIKTYKILLLVFITLMMFNPFNIYNLGFIFSFTISMFLIVFSSLINRNKNYFKKLFVTSFISILASIPIQINNFNSINLLSIFSNLIFVPLVTFIVFPLSIITIIIKPLDNVLFFITNLMDKLSLFLNNFKLEIILCSVPFYIIIIYYFIIILILYKMINKKYNYILILVLIIFIHTNINYVSKYSEVHMIDIGQGDSILIKLKNNLGNILIDTGGDYYLNNKGKNVLVPYLKSIGIKKLDYLIITHGDMDHIGSSDYLINNYKVDNILLNSYKNNVLESNLINKYEAKNVDLFSFNLNNYRFNLINKKHNNENEDSLVLYTVIDKYKLLFLGDINKNTEKELIYEYNLNNMDILKIGHHGSKYSTSNELLEKINPKVSLISAGLNNRFNHPNKETLDLLNNYNLQYFITSINGSIKIILNDNMDIYTRF